MCTCGFSLRVRCWWHLHLTLCCRTYIEKINKLINSLFYVSLKLRIIHDFQGELLDITWNHLVEADRTPPSSLIKERLCVKLEIEDYVAALSCIRGQYLLAALPDFSLKAWSKLLEENSKRFQKGTLVRLVHEVSNITARSDQPNPALDNLLASCKKLLRTCAQAHVEPKQTFSSLETEPALTF